MENMLANKTALIRRNTEVKEASTPVHEVRIKIVKDSKLFLKPETATRVAYMLERREMNGWGLGSLARALMALKGGALASRVSWNRAISLVHKNAPAFAIRCRATARSCSFWLLIPSTSKCTSIPLSSKSNVVCSTHTCASMPSSSTCLTCPRFWVMWASTSGVIMENSVFSKIRWWLVPIGGAGEPAGGNGGGMTSRSSCAVRPSALGYCSVATTGKPSAAAPRSVRRVVSIREG
mmetsp:Transcript_21021/g.58413  ORF Transcript_21021/g.58413 Transcript_21021/m.58413 type:complete len:236 (+) Transcript_21021:128-835(+)